MRSPHRNLGRALILGPIVALLSCSGEDLVSPPTAGSIAITTTTTGPEPDQDGYAVSVNDGAEVGMGVNGTHQVNELPAGSYAVRLGGMATNCTVDGGNPRTVSVEAGATATVQFNITCRPTTGSALVTAATTGSASDPDGYSVTLDGLDRGALAINGELTVGGLASGDHVVGLSGIAANCQAAGENPRAITVTAGSSVTAAFVLTCTTPPAASGAVRLATTTSGASPDPDGYAFAVDGGAAQPIGTGASTTVAAVAAGNHSVTLSGLAGNCTVQGTNPRAVTVAAGATAEVSFAVTCTAATGSLRIKTTTTGDSPDPDGYTATVDAGTAQSIDVNGTRTVSGLNPGSHQVTLGGLASNCTVSGSNPRSATVNAGNTVEISFSVSCPTISTTGSIEITTATTGSSQDNEYMVAVDNGTAQPIGANTSITVSNVAAGQRQATLGGIAANCTVGGENPRPVTVTAGSKSTVKFDISCAAPQSSGKIVWVKRDVNPRVEDPPPQEPKWDIYVMNPDGTAQTNLTNRPALYTNPIWSPDRTRIAFNSSRDGNFEVYVMNADGSAQVRLTNDPADDFVAGWSPDGTTIFYVSGQRGTSEINVTTREESSTHITGVGEPRWSPDGRKIVFWRDFDIYVINADGTGETQVTHDHRRKGSAAWSPDGTRIAFTGSPDATELSLDIFVVNSDGSNLSQLTRDPADDTNPVWSPDGQKIAFESYRSGTVDVFVMNANGTVQTNLTNDPVGANNPTWSSNGSQLAFVSSRDESPQAYNREIYVMNADGSAQRRLTDDPRVDESPSWSR